jgi:hypothetical protein
LFINDEKAFNENTFNRSLEFLFFNIDRKINWEEYMKGDTLDQMIDKLWG